MYILISLFIFILGTLIGSFLNVVILRYGTGKKIVGVKERSMCFSCAKTLEWYELLPVASFVCLQGKCKGCKAKISLQYPLVEIVTGLIFTAVVYGNYSVFFRNDFSLGFGSASLLLLTLFQLTIWSILIVITVYDFRHKIIPDALVYAFSGLSLGTVLFFPQFAGITLKNSLLAGIAFFCFFAGMWLVSRGRWLGFGDAKLVLGVGFLLGIVRGLSALVLAFWIGAVVSIGVLAWQSLRTIQSRRLRGRGTTLTMKSEIPFAPFIILGTLIAFFWYVDILGIAAFF